MSSILLWEMPWRLWTKSITVGTPAGRLRRRRAGGRWGGGGDAADFLDRRVARSISSGWKGKGWICQIFSNSTSIVPRRDALAPPRGEHLGERVGVEVALVEHHVAVRRRPSRCRARYARPTCRRRRCWTAISRTARCSLRHAGERVAAGAIGVEPEWAAWPVNVIACRSTPNVPAPRPSAVHRLEHRALLDVQLEVGGGVLQLAGLDRAVESRCRARRPHRGVHAVAVGEIAQLVLGPSSRGRAEPNRLRPKRAPSSSAQSTRRMVTGGVALRGDAPQDFEPGESSGSRRATRRWEPNRCGRRSAATSRRPRV